MSMIEMRSRLRHTAALTPPTVAVGTVAGMDPDAVPVLVSCDYSRLRTLARLRCCPDDSAARVLADTLGRCRVVPPDAVPPAVAVLGARVAFAVEGSAAETRILVMPEDDVRDGFTLAVSTPFGAALLGATAGQFVEAVERDGRCVVLRILAVDQHPELRPARAMLPDRRAPHETVWCRRTPDDLPWAGVRSKYGECS